MRRKHLSISILTKINNLSQSAKLFRASDSFFELTGRNPGLAAYFAFSFRCTSEKYVCHRMHRFAAAYRKKTSLTPLPFTLQKCKSKECQ